MLYFCFVECDWTKQVTWNNLLLVQHLTAAWLSWLDIERRVSDCKVTSLISVQGIIIVIIYFLRHRREEGAENTLSVIAWDVKST